MDAERRFYWRRRIRELLRKLRELEQGNKGAR